MPIRQIKGGRKLREHLRQMDKAGRKSPVVVDVGFFSTSRYPDGTPVALVAAWNEFGTERIPERPFFRNMVRESDDEMVKMLKKALDPSKPQLDETVGDLIGMVASAKLKKSITDLRDPPNAPGTVSAKRSSNPLIDTGFMRMSATWRVNKEK